MRGSVTLICVLLAPAGAFAQPADCPVEPPASGETIPLLLDLQGMPGVPHGLGGYVGANVPMAAPGMACADPTPGNGGTAPPSDVLRGDGSGDVLSGGRVPRVEVIDVR